MTRAAAARRLAEYVFVALARSFCFQSAPVKPQFIFVTGTDTAIGKTVCATLLTRALVKQGHAVAALKPISSGDRSDAQHLHAAQRNTLTLDEINPWHFRAPLAPLLAARREGKSVRLPSVIRHLREVGRAFAVVVIEGAGGLLSPLGENFASRDLIAALGAAVVIVAPNRIGVVNHVLLTLEALPPSARRSARVVLVSQPHPDAASRSNARLISEFVGANPVSTLPWLRTVDDRGRVPAALRRLASALLKGA